MDELSELEPEELRPYENKWIAIDRSGEKERIVGSGDTLLKAKRDAESNGYSNPVFMKVPRFDAGFVGGLPCGKSFARNV